MLIHERFARQTSYHPQKLGIVLENQSLSYAELLYSSQCLAAHIIDKYDIKPGDVIIQCVEKSIEMVIGIFAILMSDAIYCPVSSEEPAGKIDIYIDECQPKAFFVHPQTINHYKRSINLSECIYDIMLTLPQKKEALQLSNKSAAQSLAVIQFTSGSTGRPKGVALSHGNILSHLDSVIDGEYLSKNDTVLQRTSVTFDAHLVEIIHTLCIGACTVLMPAVTYRDPISVLNTIKNNQVSFLFAVPTFLATLLEQPTAKIKLATIQRVHSGGEVLQCSTAARLLDTLPTNARLWLGYGPAECTVYATAHLVSTHDVQNGSIPIGRPLSDYECLILDEQLHQVSDGQHGELVIGGQSVFTGYFRQPQWTADALINLQNKEGKFYRTGDIVYLDPSTNLLYFVERKDFQVKLRGQRIETGEIENVLQTCALVAIERAIIIKTIHMDQEYLVAYIQLRHDVLDSKVQQKLYNYCKNRLSLFMVPSLFVAVHKFPMNSNGKLDRKALPVPDFSQLMNVQETIVEPQTKTEHTVLSLWKNLLGFEKISTDTNFFALGGNSLLLMRLIYQYQTLINSKRDNSLMDEFYNKTTIMEHACLLDNLLNAQTDNSENEEQHITSTIVEGPASISQVRLYTDTFVRFLSSDDVYTTNATLVFEVDGILLVSRLRAALSRVINKHATLRTSLNVNPDTAELRQRIIDFNENCYDFVETTVNSRKNLLELIDVEQKSKLLLNVSLGLVFRCHIIHLLGQDTTNNVDFIVFNTIDSVMDDAGIGVFMDELKLAYTDPDNELKPLPFRYIDFACWEVQFMQNTKAKADMQFWQDLLNETTSIAFLDNLPYDRSPQGMTRSGRGYSFTVNLSESLSKTLRFIARDLNVTINHLALAAYYVFLFKLTYETELQVGIVCGNPYGQALFADMVGFFANTLPIRCRLNETESFVSLIEQVKSLSMAALIHSSTPYQAILKHTHAFPLRILFRCGTPMNAEKSVKLDENITLLPRFDKPDFVFDIIGKVHSYDNESSLRCTINASADLFDETTVQHMAQRFASVLTQLPTSLNKSLSSISLLLPHEHQLLSSFDILEQDLLQPDSFLIHEQFMYQSQENPQKISVILEDQCLSYAELLYLSQYLANNIVREAHVTSGDIMCQCVERSIEMIIGVMAILMSGGVYCPLSPDEPQARLDVCIEECQPRCILVHSQTANRFDNELNSAQIIIKAFDPAQENVFHFFPALSMDSLAIVVFTSGSTGRPKGVCLSQRNFVNYLAASKHEQILLSSDIVLQRAPVTVSMHLQDIVSSLCVGASIVAVRPGNHRDITYLLNLIKRHQITFVFLVPSLLAAIFEDTVDVENKCGYLRLVLTGGEELKPEIAKKILGRLAPHTILMHACGQTESTLNMIHHEVFVDDVILPQIPIGRPFPGYPSLVLDPFFQPVIPGRSGELFIGGASVFSHYINRPELTSVIRIDIEGKDGKWLRTGDFVRMDPSSGLLLYGSRKDFQIKLRGQRIECKEIEHVLYSCTAFKVNEVVVTKYEHAGEEYLIAYVQILEEESDVTQQLLHLHCEQHLPTFMIPSYFVFLKTIPRNSNGKIDRKMLPKPDFIKHIDTHNATVEPETEAERIILLLWKQILNIDVITHRSNFFTLGGTSLLFMRLVQQYQTKFSAEQKSSMMAYFFEKPTFGEHVRLVEKHLSSPLSYSPSIKM